jgi:tRNA A-37 threonylcarbamoyl transferase component Bud32
MVACPQCGEEVSIQPEDVGSNCQCPHCGGAWKSPVPLQGVETLTSPSGDQENQTLSPSVPVEQETAAQSVSPGGLVDAELFNHRRYRVIEFLGSGGMGAVYKAEHQLMKRTVALKVIRKALVDNPSTVERFHREVQAAARLHHPNIVAAYDAEQAGDVHFLVMEYVRGTDLHQVVAERGPLPVARACGCIRQAALGLQHAMELGMVHRDIKPENLILTPDGQVKILDFGLAALAMETVAADSSDTAMAAGAETDRLTLAGTIMGTPDYMAPEQARDAHGADIRADIYSLGCTFYYLLTGEVPFSGSTYLDKIRGHAESSPRPIGKFRKSLPTALVRLVDRMMAKDPIDRPASPAAVAESLRAIEGNLVPCPKYIKVASWTWITWGALIIGGYAITVALAVYFGRSAWTLAIMNPCLWPLLVIPGGFLYKGARTLSGREADTLGNGVGSIGVGLALGGFGLMWARTAVLASGRLGTRIELVAYLTGGFYLLSGVALFAAGLLALVHRKTYLRWVRMRRADHQSVP